MPINPDYYYGGQQGTPGVNTGGQTTSSPGVNPDQTSANSAVSTLLAPLQPTLDFDNYTMGNYAAQLGNIGNQVNQENQYAQTMAGLQGQQQGIANQQLGLQALGNTQSQQNSQYQQGLETQEFGNSYQSATLGNQSTQIGQGAEVAQFGNTQQNAQYQQGLEQQQFGLSQLQYGQDYAQAATANQQAMMGLQGQVATSGVQGAAGANLSQAAQKQNYGFQLQDIGINQQQSQLSQAGEVAGYNTQQANANIGQQAELQQYGIGQQQFGLSQQNAQLGQQGEIGNYNLSQEQYANQASNLSYMAQSNGLSEQETLDQLNYGIGQNKQAGIADAGQLLGNMGNLAMGEVSAEQAALGPLAYAGNVNPFAAT